MGYDYVVVGGGSAGCVLAARLSENSDCSVLLLEAGSEDNDRFIHMPIGFAKMTKGPYTWGLKTAPQKHANDREIPFAQARVIGGGSSINAEIFTRGHRTDYDRWAADEHCAGWAFDDVQRYFIKSENNAVFNGAWHGTDGPLGVSSNASPEPISLAFVRSCQQMGMPYNPDFNGQAQDGAGIYQTTTRHAKRCSAAVGYLKPARQRPNLTVKTNALITRIVVENKRAVGVDYSHYGRPERAMAQSEVVVTAGAIGSPKLLMLSGIGPADHLRESGVDVVHDLPGVGENLQDHFGIDLVYELKGPTSLDRYKPWYMTLLAGLQYELFKTGPVLSNIVEGGAFWYADGAQTVPDLQFHFLAAGGVEAGVPRIPSGYGCTVNSYNLRPKSRGSVRLRSDDAADQPIVDPNYIAEPDDLKTSIEGIRQSREIFNQPALQAYISREHFPGDQVKSSADFEAYARQYGRTSYHPVGTCKMGTDPLAVVDPQCRVHGLDGLRVCDSSIMPSLIGSNTNAPTIMIGEKAADLIRGNR